MAAAQPDVRREPNVGVKVPNAGVRMQVQQQDRTAMRVKISSTK